MGDGSEGGRACVIARADFSTLSGPGGYKYHFILWMLQEMTQNRGLAGLLGPPPCSFQMKPV